MPKEQHSSHTNNWAVLVRCCTSYSTVVTVYDTGIGVFPQDIGSTTDMWPILSPYIAV